MAQISLPYPPAIAGLFRPQIENGTFPTSAIRSPSIPPRGPDPIQLIQECERDEERIFLAADLAHSRSLGRHPGADILILYRPWDSHGDYSPADSALAWLKIHGSLYGVYLRER